MNELDEEVEAVGGGVTVCVRVIDGVGGGEIVCDGEPDNVSSDEERLAEKVTVGVGGGVTVLERVSDGVGGGVLLRVSVMDRLLEVLKDGESMVEERVPEKVWEKDIVGDCEAVAVGGGVRVMLVVNDGVPGGVTVTVVVPVLVRGGVTVCVFVLVPVCGGV